MLQFLHNRALTFLVLLLTLGALTLLTRLTQHPHLVLAETNNTEATLSFDEVNNSNSSYTSTLSIDPGSNSISGVDFTFQLNKDIVKNAIFTPSSEFSTQLLNKFDPTNSTLRYSAVETSSKTLNTPFALGKLTLTFNPGINSKGEITILKSQVIASGKDTSIPISLKSKTVYQASSSGISKNILLTISIFILLTLGILLYFVIKKTRSKNPPINLRSITTSDQQ